MHSWNTIFFQDQFAPHEERNRPPRDGAFPPNSRVPHNRASYTVAEILKPDLKLDLNPLIVTGYSSIEQLIELIASLDTEAFLSVLLGNEPYPLTEAQMTLRSVRLEERISDFWLTQRISLTQYPNLIKALDNIKQRQLDIALLDLPGRNMHAKLYIANDTAVVGSSNFSRSGLYRNLECNVRFKQSDEAERYRELKEYGHALFSMGTDYNKAFTELLEKLIRPAQWYEALAKSCAELLEGNWAKQYTQLTRQATATALWPSQIEGIAQALWILETLGSVLIADATGSGKTKTSAALQRALQDMLWRTGRVRSGSTALITPPGVIKNWQRELLKFGLLHQPLSQGALSHRGGAVDDYLPELLKLVQILVVDEAHNYLNANSSRTQFLLRNLADYVMLLTATPLNRSPSDLLSLVNILGADNFDPEVIKAFNKLLKKPSKVLFNEDTSALDALKSEIQRFTVRRTKADFNRLIDKQPDAYRSKNGDLCRYPTHRALPYSTNESPALIQQMEEVHQLVEQLHGVANITKTIREPVENSEVSNQGAEYINQRAVLAARLARYQVLSHLRSSRVAAYSHIAGAEQAMSQFELSETANANHTGVINTLQELTSPPGYKMDAPIDESIIPEWIFNQSAFHAARLADISIYRRILAVIEQMDDSRESAKLQFIAKLYQGHSARGVIAFDRHPLTLEWLKQTAVSQDLCPEVELLTATGNSKDRDKNRVNHLLDNEYRLTKNALVLCSDAMSEGYNLQNADVVVHLDMPSVVRLVEQRTGRVDRMDSVFEQIEVYWPKDHESFALRRDDKLYERYEANALLWGSNFVIPKELYESSNHSDTFRTEEVFAEHTQLGQAWDGIEDAFSPVRRLIGDHSLITPAQYKQIASGPVASSLISAVRATHPWGFFCIQGTEFGAPKWVLLDEHSSEPVTDIEVISARLTSKLSADAEGIDQLEPTCHATLEYYLKQLHRLERRLLPRRKQVALHEMHAVMCEWCKLPEYEESEILANLRTVLERDTDTTRAVHWAALADTWLELARPFWYQAITSGRGRHAVQLKEIRNKLVETPISLNELESAFEVIPSAAPVGHRVSACILGVGSHEATRALLKLINLSEQSLSQSGGITLDDAFDA